MPDVLELFPGPWEIQEHPEAILVVDETGFPVSRLATYTPEGRANALLLARLLVQVPELVKALFGLVASVEMYVGQGYADLADAARLGKALNVLEAACPGRDTQREPNENLPGFHTAPGDWPNAEGSQP